MQRIYSPLLLVALIVLPTFCYSQPEAENWYFGMRGGISFATGKPLRLSDGGAFTGSAEAAAVVSERNTGQLLFYAGGNCEADLTGDSALFVYSFMHRQILQLKGHGTASQGVVIIPDPGDSLSYYIFSNGPTSGACGRNKQPFTMYTGLFATRLTLGKRYVSGTDDRDFRLNRYVNAKLVDSTDEPVAATLACDGRGYWVIVRNYKGFYAIAIRESGIDTNIVFTAHDMSGLNSVGFGPVVGSIEISPDARLIASLAYEQNSWLFKFDNATGKLSQPIGGFPNGYSASFSPNSKLLYYLEGFTLEGYTYLYQYDVGVYDGARIVRLGSIIPIRDTTSHALQIALDKKLYMLSYGATMLCIPNPNTKGTGATVQRTTVSFGDIKDFVRSVQVFPNFTDNIFADGGADIAARCALPQVGLLPDTLCEGSCKQYVANKRFNPTSYSWTFEGGSPAVFEGELPPPVCYAKAGSYKVQLIACNANGCDTAVTSVVVHPKPRITTPKAITLCPGSQTTLRANGATRYEWRELGKSAVLSTVDSLIIQPTASINYTVRAMTDYGCEALDTIAVQIGNIKAVARDTAVCKGDKVMLHASGGSDYVWREEGGSWSANTADAEVSPSVDTRYTVVVSSGNCRDSVTIQVKVLEKPIVQTGDTTVCSGNLVQLAVDNVQSAVSYQWRDVNGVVVDSGVRVQVTATRTTSYIVRATNGAGCTAEDTAFVTVNNAIVIDAGKDQSICAGEAAELSIVNVQKSIVYEWQEESGKLIGSGEKIGVSPLQNTRYVVHGSANGCEGWDTVAVTVNALPQVQVEDQSICEGQNAELSIMNYEVSLQYEWKEEGGKVIGSGQRVSVSPTATTRYIVEANNTNSCIARDTVTVSVEPKTRIVLSVSDSVGAETKGDMEIIIYAQANRDVEVQNLRYSLHATGEVFGVEGAKYINGEVVIAQQQKVKLSTSKAEIARIKGVALVSQRRDGMIRITDMSTELDTSCTELSSTVGKLHTEPVCANNLRGVVVGKEVLLLSPNPSTGKVDLQSEYAMEELRVYNSLGEEVQVTAEGTESHRRSIDLSASGIYFVRVKMFGSWLTRSVVVQH